VLTQPADRRADAMTGLREALTMIKATTLSLPTQRARGDRYIDLGPACRPEHRLFGITHIGWYHTVLTQPVDRRADAMTGLREALTAVVIELKHPMVRAVVCVTAFLVTL
jgi:hypothetical protein